MVNQISGYSLTSNRIPPNSIYGSVPRHGWVSGFLLSPGPDMFQMFSDVNSITVSDISIVENTNPDCRTVGRETVTGRPGHFSRAET